MKIIIPIIFYILFFNGIVLSQPTKFEGGNQNTETEKELCKKTAAEYRRLANLASSNCPEVKRILNKWALVFDEYAKNSTVNFNNFIEEMGQDNGSLSSDQCIKELEQLVLQLNVDGFTEIKNPSRGSNNEFNDNQGYSNKSSNVTNSKLDAFINNSQAAKDYSSSNASFEEEKLKQIEAHKNNQNVSGSNSLDKLNDQESAIADLRKVSTMERIANSAKERIEYNTEEKIRNQQATNLQCNKDVLRVNIRGVKPSPKKEWSLRSINSEMPWSEWISIPGTTLQIRYSNKKTCKEPEFPNTIDRNKNLKYINEGVDQFFDYGFLQLRNISSSTISGRFKLITKDDKKTYDENWGIFLEPYEIGKEDLGNWYNGCEAIEFQLLEYCEKK